MIERSIVNKYAKTLSILMAKEKEPESIFEDFFCVVDALSANKKAIRFFLNPSINLNTKLETLSKIFNEINIPEKYGKFVIKILKNNRFKILFYLKPITKKYLYDELGIVEVDLTVPVPLTKEKEEKFIELFGKRSGRKVKLNVNVDKSIIAGVIAKMGSLVIDGSVKTKIFKIKEKLTGEL